MTPPEEFEEERTIFINRAQLSNLPSVPDLLGHYLVVIAGNEPGKRIEIGTTPLTIGRDARQTLAFADSEVSRLHARVSIVGGEAIAEDMGSTNGTFVDAKRLDSPFTLHEGNILRVGGQLLKYERRSRKDVERSRELDRDLLKASSYVFSILPAPLDTGAVLAAWRYLPSTQLGGDGFGYHWLEPGVFVFYLIDVSGHGVGPAMHSVTVLNLLRQRALPHVDFRKPADVLSSLNERFQMTDHDGMYFTMWYGVYHTDTRKLVYGSAGHHPAYVVPADRSNMFPAGMPALMIGAMPDGGYEARETTVPPGATVYLFSDGVFEILTTDQQQWDIDDFLPLLLKSPIPGTPEPERLFQAVKKVAGPQALDDDFSLVAATFP